MGTTLCGILTVYEAVDIFPVFIVMGNGYFDVFSLQVDHRIPDLVFVGLPHQQVVQPVLAHKLFPVKIDDQSSIEVTVVPDLVLEVFRDKMKIPEYLVIWYEGDDGAV
jgi:hypothetical protein